MTRDPRMVPWPLLHQQNRQPRDLQPIGKPRLPDGTPNYQYLDCGRWWISGREERQEER